MEDIKKQIARLQFWLAATAEDLEYIKEHYSKYDSLQLSEMCANSPRVVEFLFSRAAIDEWDGLLGTSSEEVAKLAAVYFDSEPSSPIKLIKSLAALKIYLKAFPGLTVSRCATSDLFDFPAAELDELVLSRVPFEPCEIFLHSKSHPDHFRVLMRAGHSREIAFFLRDLSAPALFNHLQELLRLTPDLVDGVLTHLITLYR